MNVIPFLLWRVWCYLDEDGHNVIRSWLDQEHVAPRQKSLFQLYIRLIESGGPEAVPGCIFVVSEEEGFYAMNIKAAKGEEPITPLFCFGPFGDSEITLLAGSPIQSGILQAQDVLPIARHNLEILRRYPKRRRRERIA